ncbi:hypothetical protein [Rhodoblastus sp.]|uniref:hypothetical protein n=1 Tax=Rhodoblastus sp. TaxID=1962975 RepID=UPI0026174BA0|nr:hypothetical protein [Rhodoblastus sp.]
MNDFVLKSAGLACAAGSVWFAVFMFNHQEGGPRINAMQDFAIFAQPNRVRAVEAAVRAAAIDGKTRRTRQSIAIDMTPVGSAPSASETKSTQAPANVRIVDLSDGAALIETSDGFRRVRVGDEHPAIGKILSIRQIGEYWVVVASARSLAQIAPEKREGGASRQP